MVFLSTSWVSIFLCQTVSGDFYSRGFFFSFFFGGTGVCTQGLILARQAMVVVSEASSRVVEQSWTVLLSFKFVLVSHT
jgi:hypothetical protein